MKITDNIFYFVEISVPENLSVILFSRNKFLTHLAEKKKIYACH
jgi:hypothetical protein